MVGTTLLRNSAPIKMVDERLATLEKYNIYTTLAALKRAVPNNVPYKLIMPYGAVDYFYKAGDFTGKVNDDTVIELNTVPASVGALIKQTGASIDFDGRSVYTKLQEMVSVKDVRFAGGAKGDGVTDDTVALQAVFDAISFGVFRSVYFPPGKYCVSQTLRAPVSLSSFQFSGGSGYDGVRGPINYGLATSLKWIGPNSPTKAVVQFDQSSGVRWKGISIDCDGKVGYGLQFMSSDPATGGVKCIVENCSIHYSLLDGIIVGKEGIPTAPPAGRQFFGNVFRNLTFYGCKRSSIHINEWNADQQIFDSVTTYFDDRPNPVPVDYSIWFDHGGQWSDINNCQAGGLTVDTSRPGTGYMIFNKGNDNGISGAFGLSVRNCWQEGEGGIYYGVTSTNDNKGFTFTQCASFTSNINYPSVYIDKGTSDSIAYTFINCAFSGDLKIGTAAFNKNEIVLLNNKFSQGKGLVDASNRRSTDGLYIMGNTVNGTIVVPRFVDTLLSTLVSNIGTVFAEGVGKAGDRITLIITQDVVGGRTIDWSKGGSMSMLPPIPQPATAPGAKTVYTFVSDGSLYYLSSVIGVV